jgi:dehydrogenase/reductase SDR family protein 12
MIILKMILLQAFWFLIVLYGKSLNTILQISLALLFVFLDYYFCKVKVSIGRYLFYLIVFFLCGLISDFMLINLNLTYNESYQYGNISLWIIFLVYYNNIFSKFQSISTLKMSIIGGVAGAFTYYSAVQLGAAVIPAGKVFLFLAYEFFVWAVFFPFSMKIYFNDEYWDFILDKTILFSFDNSGFVRHEKKFNENFNLGEFLNKNALITGGTSGIGNKVLATFSQLGIKVNFTGRNIESGKYNESLFKNSKFTSLDMSNWDGLYHFAKDCTDFDYVVFNAGSMPEKYLLNHNGVEFQCASQLVGHYLLLCWLKEFNKLKKSARVVWISSGGMYLKQLDLENLFQSAQYDKVETYANVKRAQVTLVEELAKNNIWSEFNIYSMHPGWVSTDGLKEALPSFFNLMKRRLRNEMQGADTIIWCLLTKFPPHSGSFCFDRKVVSPYLSKKYIPNQNERSELLKKLQNIKLNFRT